jgi:hypothetical protein
MNDAQSIDGDDNDDGDWLLVLIVLWFTALLGGCGDNFARPTGIEVGGAQTPATFVVAKGTYTPTIDSTALSGGRVSWVLSADGDVYLQLAVRRLDEIVAIQIDGDIKGGTEPVYTVIDQVGNEVAELDHVRETSIGQQGRARLVLGVPLIVGSRGEFVSVRVTTTQTPVQIFSLDWSSQ